MGKVLHKGEWVGYGTSSSLLGVLLKKVHAQYFVQLNLYKEYNKNVIFFLSNVLQDYIRCGCNYPKNSEMFLTGLYFFFACSKYVPLSQISLEFTLFDAGNVFW